MSNINRPIIPEQLEEYRSVLEPVHDTWSSYTHADVLRMMPEARTVELNDGERARVVILEPEHESDTSKTLVLGLPYQQAWKPSMFIRAKIAQQVAAPDHRLVVLPENSLLDRYYSLSYMDMHKIDNGTLRPLYEKKVRILEALGALGEIALGGYSFGALNAIGIASVGSDKLDIAGINADEAPNVKRTPKQLQKDFMASGGWGAQRAAIEDAQIGALRQELAPLPLALDYLRFGVASLKNKIVSAGMASPDFAELLDMATKQYPDTVIKLGSVAGSKLFDISHAGEYSENLQDMLNGDRLVLHRQYGGTGTHAHATGDNPYAHALMWYDGIPEQFVQR